jgi:hypothetical protein
MSVCTPEEYRADGGFSVVGLPLLMLALFATAVALGWLASFIGQWFYLVFIFPLAVGIALVFAGIFFGHMTKMRNRGIATLLGLMSAAVAMLAMHDFDYQRFISERDAALAEAKPAQRAVLEVLIQKQLPIDSFFSFMDHQATRGVTIGKRGGGWNLGYAGTWIYWGLELVVVAVLATLGLISGASAPFCSACDTWKEDRRLGMLTGNCDEAIGLLKEGKVGDLARHKPASTGGSMVLGAAVCPRCGDRSSIAVKLEEVTVNDKGEVKKTELVHLSYPGEALAEFQALFAAAEARKDEPEDAAAEE